MPDSGPAASSEDELWTGGPTQPLPGSEYTKLPPLFFMAFSIVFELNFYKKKKELNFVHAWWCRSNGSGAAMYIETDGVAPPLPLAQETLLRPGDHPPAALCLGTAGEHEDKDGVSSSSSFISLPLYHERRCGGNLTRKA